MERLPDGHNVNPREIHIFLESYQDTHQGPYQDPYQDAPEFDHFEFNFEDYLDFPPEHQAYDGSSISDASERAGTTTTAPEWLSSNTSYTSYTPHTPYTQSAVTEEESPGIITEEAGYWTGDQALQASFNQSNQENDLRVSLQYVGGAAPLPQSPVSTPMLAVPSPSPRPGPGQKRTRNPLGEQRDKVAKVRENGACVRCHIRHVSCDVGGPCKACEKYLQKVFAGDRLSEEDRLRVCTVQRLYAVRFFQDQAISFWSEPHGPVPWRRGGMQCFGQAYQAQVAFRERVDTRWPPSLQLTVQQCAVAEEFGATRGATAFRNQIQWAIPHQQMPFPPNLVAWSEAQLSWEGNSDFQSAIGSFLHCYSVGSRSLPEWDLVRKTHEMRCWYRIWQSPTLFVRSNLGSRLPSTAHYQLRSIADSALRSHEASVMKRLDTLAKFPIKKDLLLPPWACFWQLMLLYRDLKARCMDQRARSMPLQRVTADFNNRSAAVDLLQQLLTLLIVQYSTHFANHSPVHYSQAERAAALGNDPLLLGEFENVCNQRIGFLRSTFDASDRYLKMLVVNHDLDLDRRKSKKGRT